ncbi:MAG: carboxypeptidase-like regulatory domain-containing protein [Saprospiraceae bacterium]
MYALAFFIQNASAQTFIKGEVTDGTEPLRGVTVKLMHQDRYVSGGITDKYGAYQIALDSGTYNLELWYIGFQNEKIPGVKVLPGQTTIQNVVMSTPNILKEAEFEDFKIPLRDPIMSGKGMIDFSEKPQKANPEKPKKPNKKPVGG